MSRGGGLAALAILVFALAMLFASVLRHPIYTPDGVVYARYAAHDAGASEHDATLQARAFYERSPLVEIPRYRTLVELDPQVAFARSRPFVNRILYPALAAPLLGAAGFRALWIVSAAAYVLFGLALFWMLGAFRVFWPRLVLPIAVLALPFTRGLAARDLTDMLAELFWTIALGALLRSMTRERTPMLLAVLAASSVALVLTRPTPYLIALPALAAGILAGAWPEFAAALLGVAAFIVTALLTHAFGVGDQLRWIYDNRPVWQAESFAQWLRGALWETLRSALSLGVRTAIAPAALLAAFYAGRGRYNREMWVLAAAFVACLLSLLVNPVPDQIVRVAGFPLVPVFCAMAAAGAARLAEDRRSDRLGARAR